MEETLTNEEIQIYPLSKGKRLVAFLADFFLSFVISFVSFHLVFYPLLAFSFNLYGEQEICLIAQKERDSVLYNNSLLFFDEEKSDDEASSFSTNLEYTCKSYVSSLLKGDYVYDVFRHYFVDIRQNKDRYVEWMTTKDTATKFFSYSPTVSLLPEYVDEFSPIFEEGNSPSKQGQEDYGRFQKEFFLPCFSSLLQDITENDLSYNGVSYNQKQGIVTSFAQKANAIVVSSAALAYLLGTIVVFVIVPLFSKTRKTLGMLFLRRERVNFFRLSPLRKRDLILLFSYALFANAGLLFLLPWPIVSFNELFAIPALWILSLISVFFDLVSLAVLLFDRLDRTLSDRLTASVMLEEEDMDAIYRAKGYGQ